MKAFFKFIKDKINNLDKAVNLYKKNTKNVSIPSKAYLNWGISLALEGKIDDAIEKFELSSGMPLKDPENYLNWGIALAKLHRYEEALEKFNNALKIDRTYSSAYSLKGATLIELKRTDEAFECYAIAEKLAPYDNELYINWGIALAKLNQKVKAEQKFRKALSLTPTNTNASFLLGVILYEQNKLEEAEDFFHYTINFEQTHSMAYYYLSLINTKLSKFKSALDFAAKTVQLAPFRIDFLVNLAECYYDSNMIKEAIRTYFSLRIIAAEDFMYLISAGIFWQKVKKYKKSLYFLSKAMQKPQADYLTKYYLGVTYAGLGRFTEAKEVFKSIKEEQPEFFDAHIKLAIILMQEENYKPAIEIFLNIFKKSVLYNQNYYLLAECYRLTNEYDNAVTYYKKMIEYFPDTIKSYIALSHIYFEHFKDNKNALRTIRSAYKVNPDVIGINILYALILTAENSFDEAIEKINHAIELNDNSVETYLKKLFILKQSPYTEMYSECTEFVKNKFPDKSEYIENKISSFG